MERRLRTGLTQTSDRFRLDIIIAVTVELFISPSCRQGHSQPQNTQAPSPIPNAGQAAQTEVGQWVMATKDYANKRFSALDKINAHNANQLKLAWSFSSGGTRGEEAAPLVVGDTMYVVTPFPNYLYALDLTKPGAPMKWKYDPKPSASAQGAACCDLVNRGAAYAGGKVFYNTLDNHTVAVDARTGQEVWKTKLGEINMGETMTMPPMVARDKVIVGNSGGEFGVRGRVTTLNANSGKFAWRAYNTRPDTDSTRGKIVARSALTYRLHGEKKSKMIKKKRAGMGSSFSSYFKLYQ